MLFNKLTILLSFLLAVATTPVICIDGAITEPTHCPGGKLSNAVISLALELPVKQAQLSATTCQSSSAKGTLCANIGPITIREDGRQFTFTIQRELEQGEEGVVYEGEL
jgi:hypothetical protein